MGGAAWEPAQEQQPAKSAWLLEFPGQAPSTRPSRSWSSQTTIGRSNAATKPRTAPGSQGHVWILRKAPASISRLARALFRLSIRLRRWPSNRR